MVAVTIPSNYLTVICGWEICQASFRVRREQLPAVCPVCKCVEKWRVAGDLEFTKSDRRFLKTQRIAPDDLPTQPKRKA